jgi:hypothetical protein
LKENKMMGRKKLKLLVCALAVGSIASLANADITSDLVAWWAFNDGGGNTAVDSASGIDGTLKPVQPDGPTWAVGKIDDCLEFDVAKQNYVECGPHPALDITGSLTLAAWVKKIGPWIGSGGDLRYDTIIYKPISDGSTRAYRLSRDAAANAVGLTVNTVGGEVKVRGATAVNDDEWHHVAGVYDMENTQWFLYVDAVEDTGSVAASASGNINGSSGQPLLIGSDGGDLRYWGGLIDEVRIYARALSAEDIRELYESKAFATPKGNAGSPSPADGALHADTWVNLSWIPGDSAVSHDVYVGEGFDDVNNATPDSDLFRGNQTATFYVAGFPGFAYPDGLMPGTTYYWRIDEVNDADPNSPWKGDVWSFSIPPKTAYAPDPADNAEFVPADGSLSWTGGFGSKLHTVYFGNNFDDVNNATGGEAQGITTYTPGTLKMAKTYYWRVDEFDIIETHKGDVWSFTTEGAVGSPEPSNGAVGVTQTPILTWSPGVFGASHEVYFGTDSETVKNADTSSPEYKASGNLGSESYDPGQLEWNTTYYWRIDEANTANPDSPWTGPLWSFITANFLVVDDFEDYDIGNNEIWWSWVDGLGYASHPTLPPHPGNGTGSMVGDETTSSYMEETIVHGGNQSMPVFYDNSILRYSEVEKTLTYPRDWTENGITTLSIWFRGDSANAAEILYVVLNGSAVVSHDNPDAAQVTTWTEWTIDLQTFGVNLANVNTIGLGLGDRNNPQAGGSGVMYFDDIRLYAPAQ